MSLRDAALILAQQELFEDLNSALALVGVVIEVPSEEQETAYPVAGPFESGDQPGDEDWPVQDNDGWSGDELETDEAAVHHGARGERSGPGGNYDGDSGSGEEGEGGTPRRPATRPPVPGVIASVLDSDPELERGYDRAAPRFYRSVPLPVRRVRRGSQERSGFRIRTLPLTLQSMIRVPLPGLEPDIPTVVERLALAEPVTDVPMAPRLGQPSRVRILCELGLRIGPYAEDTELLVRVLDRLYGVERVDLRWFEQSPLLGCGSGPVWTWEPCETPAGTEATVLVAPGAAGRRSDPEAVHEFAAGLAAHGAAVCTVLFGPGPRVPRFRGYPQLLVDD